MSLPTTIPVTITPEAAARVAELGMQKELDQMIAHTRQAVPGLQRLDVVLDPPYDTGDEPYLTIWATIDQPLVPSDKTSSDWGRWKVTTFPPEVCQHFAMLIQYGADHAG